jgi:transcriptional regulator with XRE-family HTH domain
MDTSITRTVEKIDEKVMAGKELGKEIKRLRLEAGWEQVELAQKIGLHQSRVSKIEKGEHNFPLETVYRLALAFDMNPFELAAIYWGITPTGLPNRDKETLDKFIKLALDYLKSLPPQLSAGQAKENRRVEDSAVHDPIADVTPDVEPPIDPGQEPTNQEPTTSSQ